MSPVPTREVPVASEVASEAAASPDPGTGSVPDRNWRWLLAAGSAVVLAVPFAVATVALRRPHWSPVLDLAMTELRLRDVGGSETTLIGLPGRIGPSLQEQGSHPGPLSFYLLAPLYRVLGSSAWAMQAATAVLNVAALVTALVVAARRGSTRLLVGVAAMLALLTAGYGLPALTQPWNPYLPLLWWVVVLLAVWAVLCGDVVLLPLVAFAATLCAQTHLPYVGLAGGLGAVAVASLVPAWRHAVPGSAERRRILRYGAAAGGLLLVLWLPPIVDQAVNDPGNLRTLYDHMASPPEEPIGMRRGLELALLHLNVTELVQGTGAGGGLPDASSDPEGSVVPGLAVLVVWAVAAVASLRLGPKPLVRLHLVVGASLLLGVVSLGRIFGKEWYYLMLWAWGIAALLLLAVGWTVVTAIRGRLTAEQGRRVADRLALALASVVVLATGASAVSAVGTEQPEPHLSEALGAVVPDTVAALSEGVGAATGRDGRYTVIWQDTRYFGSQSYGLVSELERAGFEAGQVGVLHVPITDHRVIELEDATAAVVLVTGQLIDQWREVPEAVEVAFVEPRSPEEREEAAALRSAVIDDLQADGLDDLVPVVDTNLFGASIDARVSRRAERLMARLLELGERTAVFIAPPDVAR